MRSRKNQSRRAISLSTQAPCPRSLLPDYPKISAAVEHAHQVQHAVEVALLARRDRRIPTVLPRKVSRFRRSGWTVISASGTNVGWAIKVKIAFGRHLCCPPGVRHAATRSSNQGGERRASLVCLRTAILDAADAGLRVGRRNKKSVVDKIGKVRRGVCCGTELAKSILLESLLHRG